MEKFSWEKFASGTIAARSKAKGTGISICTSFESSPRPKTWLEAVSVAWDRARNTPMELRKTAKAKLEDTAAKANIPTHKIRIFSPKARQRAADVSSGAKSSLQWMALTDLKGFVATSATNIFGQLDIWGKEFNKALFSGVASLPTGTGKSNTGEKMLDTLLAAQAHRANSFKL